MLYYVIKNTTTIIDNSATNTPEQFAIAYKSAGYTEEQIDVLTQEQFDERKAMEPIIEPQPNEIETLTNYVLDVDMRLVMVELGLI